MIVNRLRNVDAVKAVGFVSCGDACSTWFQAFRLRSASPGGETKEKMDFVKRIFLNFLFFELVKTWIGKLGLVN